MSAPDKRDAVREMVDALERQRKSKGLTIKQIADRSGISQTIYYKWKFGHCVPALDTYLRVLDALGMAVAVKGSGCGLITIYPEKRRGGTYAETENARRAADDLRRAGGQLRRGADADAAPGGDVLWKG